MKIDTKSTIKIPAVPSFLNMENNEGYLPVCAVSESQLRELGNKWTEQLIRRAREQAKNSTVAHPDYEEKK